MCVWICGFYFPVNVSSFFTVRKEECHSYYWVFLWQWPNNSGSPKATWLPKYLWSREHLNNMPQMMLEKAKNSFWFLKLHIVLFLFKLCFDQFAYLFIFLHFLFYQWHVGSVLLQIISKGRHRRQIQVPLYLGQESAKWNIGGQR